MKRDRGTARESSRISSKHQITIGRRGAEDAGRAHHRDRHGTAGGDEVLVADRGWPQHAATGVRVELLSARA